jgi:phage/plasmid-associated DNA primase
MRPRPLSENLPQEETLTLPSHVPLFVQQRLKKATGMSLAAKELRAVYEAWCATHGYEPLSPPKFTAELKRLGCDKWKSCGLMRYRDLQLVA